MINKMSKFERAVYEFEQHLLPSLFKSTKVNLLNAILDKEGEFFVQTVKLAYGEKNENFVAEKFKVSLDRARSGEDYIFDFVTVQMPAPKTPLLAEILYFCLEEKTNSVKYYLCEKSYNNKSMICSTTGDVRENYGEAPKSYEAKFRKVANLFIKEVRKIK